MKTSIVLGLLYGDEGKGNTTSFLSDNKTLVVRFNGGHQAGHTVTKNGYRHIFSSFGSGTLNGAVTYVSEYCTFYPKAFYNERQKLVENGYNPKFYIHPLAMVTTPFDIDHNRNQEHKKPNGSVGVGFGSTIKRHQESPYKLHVVDLLNKEILMHKLQKITEYYYPEYIPEDCAEIINSFVKYVDKIVDNISIVTLDELIFRSQINSNQYYFKFDNIVFEGAQGILLDMDHGFFPNVTRSNTTSKNAMEIIEKHNLDIPNVYYCMRSYATRHGKGPFPGEISGYNFKDDTNISHRYQGEFRQGNHQVSLIKHALKIDETFVPVTKRGGRNFSICCLDQTDNKILLDDGEVYFHQFLSNINLSGFIGTILNNSVNSETTRYYPQYELLSK